MLRFIKQITRGSGGGGDKHSVTTNKANCGHQFCLVRQCVQCRLIRYTGFISYPSLSTLEASRHEQRPLVTNCGLQSSATGELRRSERDTINGLRLTGRREDRSCWSPECHRQAVGSLNGQTAFHCRRKQVDKLCDANGFEYVPWRCNNETKTVNAGFDIRSGSWLIVTSNL